jgi:hypothetical protein
MRMDNIKAIIRTFVDLQVQLVTELKRTLGSKDWHYLTDVPRKGELEANGTFWRYEVHGTGVRFFSDCGVVDMNRHLDGDPRSFDAGRLAEYLSSIGQNSVVWTDRVMEFDYEHGPSILREVHATGAIQRAGSCDGELYTLPPSSSSS